MFAQFLKDSKHPKYSIAQINDYPTTTYAVQVITTLAYAWTSDSILSGDRLPPIVFGGVCFPADQSAQVTAKGLNPDLGHKHHLLCISRNMGHSRGLAVDMLHPDGFRIWLIRSLFRVRNAIATKSSLTLMFTADLVGHMKSVPTITKSEPLLWLV